MPYKNPISGIYIITCLKNNKYYIGRSVNCIKRLNRHKVCLSENKHHSFHLQKAFNKYGQSMFTFEILIDYPKDILKSMEIYWVNLLLTYKRKYGYNIQIPQNQKFIKRKISIRGPMSKEQKIKLSNINKGKKRTLDSIEKQRNTRLKYLQSEDYKIKKLTRIDPRGIRLILYNLNDNTWKTFNSGKEALEFCKTKGNIKKFLDKPNWQLKGNLVISEDKFDPNKVYKKQKRTRTKEHSMKIVESKKRNINDKIRLAKV